MAKHQRHVVRVRAIRSSTALQFALANRNASAASLRSNVLSLRSLRPSPSPLAPFLPTYNIATPNVSGENSTSVNPAACIRSANRSPLGNSPTLDGKYLYAPLPLRAKICPIRGSTLAKIPAIHPAPRLPLRHREFQHRHAPAGPANAHHLAQPAVRVGHVPQPEGHRDDLKLVVGKRQLLGVGLDERQPLAGPGPDALPAADRQHLRTKIGRHDRRRLAPPVCRK